MSSAKDLTEALERCRTLNRILDHARDQALTRPRFAAEKYEVPVGRRVKDERLALGTYFDDLREQLRDAVFLELVGVFERTAFALLSGAVGNIRGLVKERYPAHEPFARSAASLIVDQETQVRGLRGISSILSGVLNSDLDKRFRLIIEQRNHIAHGKRLGKACPMQEDELVSVLEEILMVIHSKRAGPLRKPNG